MNKLNRTLLASLALCAVTFAQSAAAQDQVKSNGMTKSPPPVTPINVPSAPASAPAKNKINSAPTPEAKTEHYTPSTSIYFETGITDKDIK